MISFSGHVVLMVKCMHRQDLMLVIEYGTSQSMAHEHQPLWI